MIEYARRSVPVVCALLLCLGIPALLTFAGCQTAPVTQRKQLLVTSQENENKLGLTAYEEVLKTEPLTKNERAVDLVRRVGQRIADVSDRPDFKWEFNVIESETQNAFCLPGGKVAVYTGILLMRSPTRLRDTAANACRCRPGRISEKRVSATS